MVEEISQPIQPIVVKIKKNTTCCVFICKVRGEENGLLRMMELRIHFPENRSPESVEMEMQIKQDLRMRTNE